MTLEQVKRDIAEKRSTMIYYSAHTLWWTHIDEDLENATKRGRARQLENVDEPSMMRR